MTDEPNGQSTNDDDRVGTSWVMPQPVFRSTEGVTPKKSHKALSEEPTETANVVDFSEDPTEVANVADISEEPTETANVEGISEPPTETTVEEEDISDLPTAERLRVIPAQPTTSKGGCALSAIAIVGLIAVGMVVVALALAYYYYYNTTPVGTFD
jgi:hypothetical protein